ncbi:aspartate ammonia-lyase [Candidatus Sumerlaeota bacterium]|nr:aspartate ammonia-lyase [Candidatus Sumerlaeota bacterium]
MTSDHVEKDSLGEFKLPKDVLFGIHTARAIENFTLSGRRCHAELIRAFGTVKQAAALTNQTLGVWKDDAHKAEAIIRACCELAEGMLDEHFPVDAMQGGAGTSLNMNVNEVIANRALQLLGDAPGEYARVSPLDDVNRHQSTNDTYPTALKLAAIRLLYALEERIVGLQEAFQTKEKEFAHIVKVGRTQLRDAALTTLGREMSAYADALSRDRWRVYKCEERLRVVNLGGTAIGTGLTAPKQYIFRVVDQLRELTGIGFARAENLIDCTQNADVFVEVSGILKALAATLIKICGDLRLMSSGPEAGLGELILPARQAGSSIMPGKVNPVIPEAATQCAMKVIGNDVALTLACANGSLELNPFLPLAADCLLESLDLLANACDALRKHCVEGLQADEEKCRAHVEGSTAIATALLPAIGYEKAAEIAKQASEQNCSVRELVLEKEIMTESEFNALITPEAICRLGY